MIQFEKTMTDTFDKAFNYLLKNEGGYSDDPDDKGGATNYGISLRFLKSLYTRGYRKADVNRDGIIDPKDIQELTLPIVKDMYRIEFWKPIEAIKNEILAIKVFDAGVNIGIRKAISILQGCLDVNVDGVIGPKTLKSLEKEKHGIILQAFIDRLCGYYYHIVYTQPKQHKFLKGWLARAQRVPA